MKLSIIIPVYNVEQYLHRCLYSVIEQNISSDEYEVIIVNDGSPDNSKSIIEEFKTKHANIKIINQKNSGLSVARNNGLKIATGDFVWFVDSDDWIESNCLNLLIENLTEDIDALHIGQTIVYDNSALNSEEIPVFAETRGIDALGNGLIKIQAQLTIYKRLFLLKNRLSFYPKILHEDMDFTPRAYYHVKRVKSFPSAIYNYYQRSNGAITSSFSERNLAGLKTAIDNLIDFESEHSFSSNSKKMWRNNLSASINAYYRILRKLDLKNNKEYDLSRKIFSKMIDSTKKKYILEGLIFSLFPTTAKHIIK